MLFVIQRELRQIMRTRAYFSMLFIAPFVQLIITGSALSTDVKHMPLTIVDYDNSRMSREIVEVGSSSASFDFKGMAASEREAATTLDEGRARIAFVIPPHFEREIKTLRRPAAQILVDGVDGNSAGVSLGYATAMLGQVQAGWAKTIAPESPSRSCRRCGTTRTSRANSTSCRG
jgi:ABC-2 type transport system permease protein